MNSLKRRTLFCLLSGAALSAVSLGHANAQDRTSVKNGLSILLVEQNVRDSLTLADRGYLLQAGRIVRAGTAQAQSADPAGQRAFLGGTTAAIV